MSISETKNPELKAILATHGLTEETAPALVLLPMVYVAWADGVIEPKEAGTIVEAFSGIGLGESKPALQLVRDWLTHQPEPKEIEEKLELLSLLIAGAGDELPMQGTQILDLSLAVAKAAGGVLGIVFTVSPEEKDALSVIREKLNVPEDHDLSETIEALKVQWKSMRISAEANH